MSILGGGGGGGNETTILVIVRHGETDWNVEGRIQGQLDDEVALNARGLAQAEAVAERLRDCPAGVILCSDLRRTRETARAIIATTGLEARYTDLLRERGLGCWERLTTAEIEERFPGALADYAADRWHYRPEGGETRADLWERSARAMEWCFAQAAGTPRRTAIVVTHGGVVQSALPQLAGHAGGVEPRIRIDNCSVSVVARTGDHTSVRLANDSYHSPSQKKGIAHWVLK